MRAGRWVVSRWSRIGGLALLLGLVSTANADEAVDSWVGGMLAVQTQGATRATPAAPTGIFGDLSLAIADSPDPVPVGSTVDYQATLNFTSTLAGTEAGSVQVTFFYTAGMVFQGASGPGWACTPGTVIQCSLGGVLTAPESTQISLQFQMPATPQSVQLRGTASYIGPPDSDPANNTNITETTQVVVVGADLSLNLQAGSSSVVAGDPVSFSAQVGNLGPGVIAGLTLNGAVNGPVTLSGLSGSGWSCTNSATSYSCSYGPNLLAGNSTPVLTISGNSGPGAGTAQLSATANAPDANAPVMQNASVNVVTPAVLSLSKTDSADPVQLGQQFSYDLTVTNSGGQAASPGLVLVDDLPNQVSFVGASGPDWSCSGSSSVQCVLGGSLAAGGSSTVRIDVRADQPGLVSNTASIGDAGGPLASASETTTIVDQPSLSFSKLADRNQVPIGETVRFDLVVRNTGSTTASDLRISDRIPAGLGLLSAAGAGWSCVDSAGTVFCNRATLAAGEESTVAIETEALGPAGAVLNFANLEVGSSSQAATASITIVDEQPPLPPDLSLSKTDDVDPVNVGAEFNYLLTVSNTGGDANDLSLTDQLPEGLTLLSASGIGWSCSGGPLVSCSFPGSLPTGGSTQVVLRVRAPTTPGQLTNQASVSTEGETNTADNSASESTTVVLADDPPPDLSLSKADDVDPVVVNAEFNYLLTISNSGGSANGLTLSDQLPEGLSLISASGIGWSCQDGAPVNCSFGGTLAGGASTQLVLRVRAPATPGQLLNQASVSTEGEVNLANNSASETTTVIAAAEPPDLNLSKTDDVDPVNAGAEFNYLLTVGNSGGVASGLTLTDRLPEGMSFISAAGTGWTCQGGALVNCTFSGTLASGASTQIVLRVRAPNSPGQLLNEASVSTEGEVNLDNNTASESTTVVGQSVAADLALGGSVEPISAAQDVVVNFLLLPSNAGPDPAGSSSLNGAAVRGLSLLSAEGAGYSCNVTASSFDCAGPALPLGAGAALTVRGRLTGMPGSSALLSAQIASPLQDPNPANNGIDLQASIEVEVPTGADLSVSKVASANPVEAGAAFSYTLSVSNAGPAPAQNVVLTDALPAGLEFVSIAASGLSCSGGPVISCQVDTLAVGASASVVINVRAPAEAAEVQNTANVSSTTTDPNPANNSATATVGVDERSAASIEDELTTLVVNDPTASAAAGPVSQICADPSPAFAEQCRILLQAADEGRSNDVSDALRAIAPDEVLGQTAAILELADRQFVNIDSRLAELRGGSGGFSLSGLTVVSGGQAVPLSLFRGMFANDEMEVGGSGDLISPWGGFINGTISWGDQDLDRSNANVTREYDSYALTAGVDYRFGVNAVAGVALGYSNLDSELSEQGEMTAKGLTLTGYGSYYINDRTYIDGRVSYNRGDLDQVRFIRFGSGGERIDLRAVGSTDSTQFSVALGAGYHYNTGPWVITPSGYVRYTDVSVDGFSESGAGGNSAVFGDQDISTVQTGIGISITRAFSLSHGVISPQFDLNFVHESTDDLTVQARLVGADPSIVFLLEPDDPDQSYGNVGLGFVYVTANGRQAYLSYRETFGLDGLSSGTINVGARFEF